jgi:hypothetical protein
MGRRGRLWLAVGSVLLALLAAATWRLSLTPEWAIYLGDAEARIQACHEIWQKPPWRARRGLARLLTDPEPDVRIAALIAWSRRPVAELLPLVERLRDEPGPLGVLTWRILLSEPGTARQWAPRLRELLAEAADREPLTELLVIHARYALHHRPEDIPWLIRVALDDGYAVYPLLALLEDAPPPCPALREELLERLDDLQQDSGRDHQPEAKPYDELEAARHASDRQSKESLILALLTATDGQFRGYAAADWRGPAGPPPAASPPVDRFRVEAEWAYAIRPNYQIEAWSGVTALTLGEGAGGVMSWLGGYDATVDIGTARFPFQLATAGRYRLWTRIWMDNKCGNSLGLRVDGQLVGEFSDADDPLGRWVWTAHQAVWLAAGAHTLDQEAWEDGVYLDQLALLPAGEPLDERALPPLNALYDPAQTTTITLVPDMQHQLRGTTQAVTVWVRRSHEALTGGTLTLTVPEPFRQDDARVPRLTFAPGSPLARATFMVRLPPAAVAGEVELVAALADEAGHPLAHGRTYLGAHYDWRTTGPLAPDDPLARRLLERPQDAPDLTQPPWHPFPATGYDRYRRLDIEAAYGPQQNRVILLATELEVTAAGRYLSLLSSDDQSTIWLDGQRLTSQDESGPAEGTMRMSWHQLAAGRHRVLAAVWQADFADPEGDDASRHTYNNYVFKWLLRQDRHTIAPGLRGVLVPP